ncbi:hypothetical protein ScPMuIL_009815 [Solemya velum]
MCTNIQVREFHNIVAEEPSFVLCTLIPNTDYVVRIYSKNGASHSDLYKSPVQNRHVRTPPDVPSSPPSMTLDSYSEFACDKKQHFYIVYWNPINDIEKNGQFLQYAVNISGVPDAFDAYRPSLHDSCGITKTQKSFSIGAWLIQGSVLILPKMNETYHLEVKSANLEGLTESVTDLDIKHQGEVLSKPKHVMVEYSSQSRKYVVSFEMVDKAAELTGVTYYWCQGKKIPVGGGYVDCKNLYWQHTEGGRRSPWIQPVSTSAPQTNDKWHFAVSVQKDNSSSGMVWQSCIFQHYGNVDYNGGTQEVSLASGPDPSTQLVLVLSFDYCDLPTKPIAYNVSYWKLGAKNDTFSVKGIAGEELYGMDRKILISNLEPNTDYVVDFRAYGEWGILIQKKFQNATGLISERLETPTNYVYMIALGILALVTASMLLVWCCIKLREWIGIDPVMKPIPISSSAHTYFWSASYSSLTFKEPKNRVEQHKQYADMNDSVVDMTSRDEEEKALSESEYEDEFSQGNRDSGTGMSVQSLEYSSQDDQKMKNKTRTPENNIKHNEKLLASEELIPNLANEIAENKEQKGEGKSVLNEKVAIIPSNSTDSGQCEGHLNSHSMSGQIHWCGLF